MRADIELDVPLLLSPAQRATQQEIQVDRLQQQIDALKAAQDEIRSRPPTVIYKTRSRRRNKSIKSRLVSQYHDQVSPPIRWAFWSVLLFSLLLLVFAVRSIFLTLG